MWSRLNALCRILFILYFHSYTTLYFWKYLIQWLFWSAYDNGSCLHLYLAVLNHYRLQTIAIVHSFYQNAWIFQQGLHHFLPDMFPVSTHSAITFKSVIISIKEIIRQCIYRSRTSECCDFCYFNKLLLKVIGAWIV